MTKEQHEQELEIALTDIKALGFRKLLLTMEEVADILRVSESALYNWRRDGVGPEFIKNGNGPRAKVMYPIRKVAEFLINTQKTA